MIKILLITLALHIIPCIARAEVLGSVGQTYEIAERDALKEIKEKAAKVDWVKILDDAGQKVANLRPQLAVRLSRAVKPDRRLVDVSYVLETDIPLPDFSGVYPKGYVINPLDMVKFPEIMVIINGDDREQIDWFKKSKYYTDPTVFVLLSDGEYTAIEKEIKKPVYFASNQIVDKFDIRAVPSVVKQAGKMLEILEIVVDEKKK
jgi:conjugal transfer pilus assembly protein TraW